MKYGNLILEKKDFVMVERYQQQNRYIEDYAHKDALDQLRENMLNAKLFDSEDMPNDIIRMYSYVTLCCESRWRANFQLVLPYEDDCENDKVSVQSTLGASVLGLAEGDRIMYGLPSKIMSLKIEKVAQSESHLNVDDPEEILIKLKYQ